MLINSQVILVYSYFSVGLKIFAMKRILLVGSSTTVVIKGSLNLTIVGIDIGTMSIEEAAAASVPLSSIIIIAL